MTLKTLLCPVLAALAMSLSAATYTTLDYENARETNTLAYVETNLVAAATNGLARAEDIDYTTNNSTLVSTIEATAPAPGNYAAVSNAAMNARAYTDLSYNTTSTEMRDVWTFVFTISGNVTDTADLLGSEKDNPPAGMVRQVIWVGSGNLGVWSIRQNIGVYQTSWVLSLGNSGDIASTTTSVGENPTQLTWPAPTSGTTLTATLSTKEVPTTVTNSLALVSYVIAATNGLATAVSDGYLPNAGDAGLMGYLRITKEYGDEDDVEAPFWYGEHSGENTFGWFGLFHTLTKGWYFHGAEDRYQDGEEVSSVEATLSIPFTNGTLALTSDIIAATNAIPAPGNYETVSNRAMTALQSYTETDPIWEAAKANYALKTEVSSAATDATNYTDSVATTLRGEIAAAEPGDYNAVSNAAMTAGTRIDGIESTTSLIYNLYASSNALFEVTNYDSRVHIPSARLLSLSSNGVYSVVWDEKTNLWANAVAATNYTDAAILAATNRFAPRAWSATTSGLGADAPSETTWISTPTTVIAGGYEFQRNITTAGEMWILTSNGMTASTNQFGFFDLSAADGTSVFRIEKTDSYLVGADADAITVSGNTATISVPVVSADHPNLRYTPSLAKPITWYREEESELPSGVSCAWSGTSGAWVCTVTSTATRGFFTFEFLQEGSLKIINGGMTDVSAGIYYNGVKYVPTVSGNELKFIAQ